VTDKQELRERSLNTQLGGRKKLRGENGLCRVGERVHFVYQSLYSKNEPQYARTLSQKLPNPTDDTRDYLDVADVMFSPTLGVCRFSAYMNGWCDVETDFYEHGAFQPDFRFRLGTATKTQLQKP